MADYEFRYQLLVAPEARTDGSGMVTHQIMVQSRVAESEDGWVNVPGRAKTVEVPASELQAVVDMADGGAKVTAYKTAIVDNKATVNSPITGWSVEQFEALMDANDAAIVAASGANTYITGDLAQEYPVGFSL